MVNETTTTTTAGQAQSNNPLEILNRNMFWGGLMSRNAEAMALAAQGTMEHAMACSEATTALGLDRARKAQDFVKACLDTREAPQLIRFAADYQRTLVEDYIGHAQKILGMTLERARSTTDVLEERAHTTLEEARKAA